MKPAPSSEPTLFNREDGTRSARQLRAVAYVEIDREVIDGPERDVATAEFARVLAWVGCRS
jgi:hypothetical protein